MRATGTALVVAAASAVSAQDAGCPPLHFIWTRATTEPPTGIQPSTDAAGFEAAAAKIWSKGYGAAGYSIFTNVTALVPGASGYPTHYPANWAGCSSENKGIEDVLGNLRSMSTKCPNTKFALGGHSQGGVVTVRTLPKIPAEIQSKIVAIAMVGSPQCPKEFKAKCKSFCNTGDSICTGDGGAKAAGRCDADKASAGAAKPGAAKGPLLRRATENFMDASSPDGFSIVDSSEALGVAEGQEEEAVETAEMRLLKREILRRAAPECSRIDSEAEAGHAAPGASGSKSHMAYNSDGFYVRAAACYVAKKFAAGGAPAAAGAS